MLLILRSFFVSEDALSLRLAAVHENSLDSRPSPSRGQALRGNDAQTEVLGLLRLRVTSDECPVTGQTDSPVHEAEHNTPSANVGTALARDRFEIENLIGNSVERLEK